MNHKERFYSAYVSTHVVPRKGEVTLELLRLRSIHWQQNFGRFLPEDRTARIIDLGCGYGSIVWWLHNLGYSNAEGIDISAEQIDLGKTLGVGQIEQGDARTFLLSRRDYYDAVFARDLLEHFTKTEILEFVDLIYRSLRTGGVLIVQAPNAESPFGMRTRYGDFTHEMAFTSSSLSQLLRVAGFDAIEVYPSEPTVYGLKSLIRFLVWKIVGAWYQFLISVEAGRGRWIVTQNLIAIARR